MIRGISVAPSTEMGRAGFIGPLLSPFAARPLRFGCDAGVAATVLHADRWSAGQALVISADQGAWATLAAEVSLVEPNHAALSACRGAAPRTKKEQRISTTAYLGSKPSFDFTVGPMLPVAHQI